MNKLCIIALCLSACISVQTSYQYDIDTDTVYVKSSTRGFFKYTRAKKAAEKLALKVCKEHGFLDYELQNEFDETVSYSTGQFHTFCYKAGYSVNCSTREIFTSETTYQMSATCYGESEDSMILKKEYETTDPDDEDPVVPVR